MSIVTHSPASLQPHAALAAAWDPDPPAEPALPLADWVYAQAALHRSPAKLDEYPLHGDEQLLELVADALQDLALGVRRHACKTPAEYAAFGALRIPGGDLDLVAVPAGRASDLARALDDEALGYLTLGTDCGRLCAAAILRTADDAELLGATSADDYLTKCGRRDEQFRDELAARLSVYGY